MVHAESSDNDFNDKDHAFSMEMSSDYNIDVNVNVFEVSKADVSTHPARHTELIDDHVTMATKMKSDGHFKYVYMALRAFIRGFLNCIRLVVVVDATHCKGKYKGIMLVPVSIDANKQVCPIAFGLGDKEINESWT
ncbi:MuDRA-like transposase [Cucumis melo var. makuwa]|uniref:MuDRA-like transposase n=1 Tax=Cucumis melo var. makuwa TaxID=1194695 RepID=A0A5D3BTD8_CUCMM|nr:MuDRA-like transposase [Cucumis melo var. makuwa]TYK01486.1 MuDRA-like transposase [Cucumis melo var. makuwa]